MSKTVSTLAVVLLLSGCASFLTIKKGDDERKLEALNELVSNHVFDKDCQTVLDAAESLLVSSGLRIDTRARWALVTKTQPRTTVTLGLMFSEQP